jgi:hypothetical protein
MSNNHCFYVYQPTVIDSGRCKGLHFYAFGSEQAMQDYVKKLNVDRTERLFSYRITTAVNPGYLDLTKDISNTILPNPAWLNAKNFIKFDNTNKVIIQ